MIDRAPIALFCFNRLQHVQQVLDTLAQCKSARISDLIIFSDGARNETEWKRVSVVRDYLKKVRGFRSVLVVEQKHNLGLMRSIIDGVSKICAERGKVVVLEDDLAVSPYFLDFLNDGLCFYEGNDRVASIAGYTPQLEGPIQETFFIRGVNCWGWATWHRAWQLFDSNGARLLEKIQQSGQVYEFDFDGSYPYTKMLTEQIAGRNQSWAVRWYASVFLAGKLTLMPGTSLVQNIGLDGSGTHCSKGGSTNRCGPLAGKPISVGDIAVEENPSVRRKLVKHLRQLSAPSIAYRLKVGARAMFSWPGL